MIYPFALEEFIRVALCRQGWLGLGCGLGVNMRMMGRMGVEDKSVDKYEINSLGCKMTQAMRAFQNRGSK